MNRIKSFLVNDTTRANVHRLISLARKKDSMAVLMHGSPDPDAIASAMALRELLKQKAGLQSCSFISTDAAVRQQNIVLMRVMRVTTQLLAEADLTSYPLIAMVDAQPPFFGASLGSVAPNVVLDHHPRAGGWHAELEDIRERYGALSTILMEYLIAARVKIPRMLSTALLYGIKTDTNNFDRHAILEDLGAYRLTFARANRQLVKRIEFNQIPDRFLKYYDYAFHHRRRYRDRIICFLGKVESYDVCVQVADFYVHIIDVSTVIIAGIAKERLIIVLRGDGYRQDCGNIAERAFGVYGNAGGHRSAARVEIPLEKLKGVISGDLTQEAVDCFLMQRLQAGSGSKMPRTPAT